VVSGAGPTLGDLGVPPLPLQEWRDAEAKTFLSVRELRAICDAGVQG
jgi:hypothetical protein